MLQTIFYDDIICVIESYLDSPFIATRELSKAMSKPICDIVSLSPHDDIVSTHDSEIIIHSNVNVTLVAASCNFIVKWSKDIERLFTYPLGSCFLRIWYANGTYLGCVNINRPISALYTMGKFVIVHTQDRSIIGWFQDEELDKENFQGEKLWILTEDSFLVMDSDQFFIFDICTKQIRSTIPGNFQWILEDGFGFFPLQTMLYFTTPRGFFRLLYMSGIVEEIMDVPIDDFMIYNNHVFLLYNDEIHYLITHENEFEYQERKHKMLMTPDGQAILFIDWGKLIRYDLHNGKYTLMMESTESCFQMLVPHGDKIVVCTNQDLYVLK